MPEAATGTPQRVLLVDDSRSIRTLVKMYMQDRHFEYFEAESGADALKVLEQHTVDLVLVDYRMEGMSGIEFAMQMRSNPNAELARVPILLMTGESNTLELRTPAQQAGVNAFVRKPVSASQLMTLVDTILPRKR